MKSKLKKAFENLAKVGKETDKQIDKTNRTLDRFIKARSEEEPPKQTIKIYFGGKFYEFDNWEEAREQGFYLID